ncbi:hypothetical protein C4564_04335 [Candidatus Microgenomates bacterium]|nr:MAG: hypothetical protein C4564_04335 [Candidatus Microgenomates bacterium]
MKRYAKYIVNHPLFSGSAVMIIGSNIGNFIAYLYHLVLARLLGPVQYGELSALLSILGMLSVTFSFLGLVVVKFVSSADKNEINSVFGWFYKKMNTIAVVLSILIGVLSFPTSRFLNMHFLPVLLLAPIFYFFLLEFLFRSYLQGLLKFTKVAISVNFEMFLRLVFGVGLGLLGFGVFGAAVGIFIGTIANYILLRYFLKGYKLTKDNNINFSRNREVLNYSLPIFITSISTYSLISFDIIFVKHYFLGYDAGLYAALSTLGKIIFYSTAPITSVMFPLVARNFAQKKKHVHIFYLSLLSTCAIVAVLVGGFSLFPQYAVLPLYGKNFMPIVSLLAKFGLFVGLYSVSTLILNYLLSIERVKVAYTLPIFSLLQVFGIFLFHSTISQVININLAVACIMLVYLLFISIYGASKQK